ncbi:hypothetical protein [Streptomyces sp. B21-083]|uniref:hypothetical protein n=1 Tax=Streptomyces sp. B21-083 TaxID=3039410 RepID=UPI002FF15F5D
MAFSPRSLASKKGLPRTAGAVAALAVGATLLAAPSAGAADNPTDKELLQTCGVSTSLCVFHPQSFQEYTGPSHHLGPTVYNCATNANTLIVGGEETVGSSDSVGLTITASAGFAKVFEVGLETSYNRTWERSHMDKVEFQTSVPSGYKGWLERGTPKRKATGWYEIQYKNRHWGHFDWYVYNYTEAGWDVGKSNGGYANFKDAPMTQQERNEHCHR